MHQPWRHRSGLSIPMRASSPACRRTKMLICSGTVGHWPRHSLRPALSTTQTAVIFCETSNPTKQVIDEPPMVRITGQRRPDRGTIGRSGANRDYRMSTHEFRTLPRTRRCPTLCYRCGHTISPVLGLIVIWFRSSFKERGASASCWVKYIPSANLPLSGSG
jgi:hypothetical protein